MINSRLLFISWYQKFLSPLLHGILGPFYGCRFIPTCSNYANEAIQKWGFWRGGRLALLRICRCHPFSEAGYDPIPHVIGKRIKTTSGRSSHGS
jgi:uncharacterized protein